MDAADFDLKQIEALPREKQERLLVLLTELKRRDGQRAFYTYFPDVDTIHEGEVIHAREKYPKHLEFFKVGADYRERCFRAANRVGKTITGGFEVTCHLTGEYPHWWIGRRFEKPTRFWAAGKTNETTRDIVQAKLLGEILHEGSRKRVTGTGMIPGQKLGTIAWKQGVQDLCDTVKVKHRSGKWSTLGFKSYQQGRSSFEGTEQHGIWLDEEPPLDVYGECLIRTATTKGIIMLTFTPLEGMSETVLQFMPAEDRPQVDERIA